MSVKYCPACTLILPLDNFHKDNTKKRTGRASHCRKCRNQQKKEYYQNNKEQLDKKTKERRQANPEVVNAQNRLKYAVRMGYLVRPNKCEKCGIETKVDAHHEDYSKALEIMWLCRRCHMNIGGENHD